MKKLLSLLVLVGVACVSLGAPITKVSADSFTSNNIIDDAIFDNSTALNAAQIDNFLNSFPNSCISPNSGFKAIDPVGYNPTSGYQYGGFVTAGQVIYDASQAYGINPQVLLATLQKEQSLVAGGTNFCNSSNQNKYAAAVGYGCPDSGTTYSYTGINLYQRNGVTVTSTGATCVNSASKAGFSQQIIRAAWLLKFGEQRSRGNVSWAVIKGNWNNSDDPQTCYGGPMTQGTYQRCPSGGSSYYDGYTTIDGTSVHIDNGPTAALYWYTPHFSGNQNFYNIFTSWFGSTKGTFLLQSPSSPAVFLQSGTTRYGVPSYDVLRAYGFANVKVTPVSDDYMNSLTDGGTLGTTFKQDGQGAVYLADNGYRFGFSTQQQCADWGFPSCLDSSTTKSLNPILFNQILNGGDMKSLMLNGTSVYLMQSGHKLPFLSFAALTQNGYTSSDITPITNPINSSQPFGNSLPENNTFLKFGNYPVIYVYNAGTFYAINSFDVFQSLIPAGTNVLNDNFSAYSTSPPPTTTEVPSFVSTEGGAHKYLLSGGYRYEITAVASDWPAAVARDALSSVINAKPLQASVDSSSSFRQPNGFMLRVQGNTVVPFYSLADFFASPFSKSPLTIDSTAVQGLPVSGPYITPGGGSVYQINDSSKLGMIFVRNTDGSACALNSTTQLGGFMFDTSNVQRITETASAGGSLKSLINAQDGSQFIVNQGTKTPVSSGTLTAWGVNLPTRCSFTNNFLNRLPNSQSNKSFSFARLSNGTIYYAQGNAAHQVLTYSRFLSLGGNSNNTVDVPDDFLSYVTLGSSIN